MTAQLTPDPAVIATDVAIQRGHQVALRAAHLRIDGGKIALVGPNGSGKSTLLHAICGLIRPSSGTLEVLGTTPTAARPRISYVLQSQQNLLHLPVTAREAVSLGRAPARGPFRPLNRVDRARVDEAMELLDIENLARHQLTEMSGGQRQRVLVAQGLAQDADLILLDEPLAGVDLASMTTIRAAIATASDSGRTVIVSTHDLGDAANYDQVVLLAGHVVAAGPPATTLTPPHLRTAYAGRILDIEGNDFALDDGSHHH